MLGDLIESDGLGHRSGKAIQNVATGAGVIGLKALGHNSDHDFVAHKLASIDDSFGHFA
jgi:hypothetical protein